MKPATRHTFFERIDRVLMRLQRAVDEGGAMPDLTELAAIAHQSAFHFHRVYRACTGETPAGSLARLRLLRALQHLADDAPVTQAALAAGYATPQAFARAFREAFGISPSALRRQPGRIAAEQRRLSRPPAAASAADAPAPLSVEVVSLQPFEVVALRTVGAYADLDRAYGQLFGWAAESGVLDKARSLWGIPHGDHRDVPPAELVFDCALQLAAPVQPPAPFAVQRLGDGEFARLRHVGAFAGLESSTDRLLAEWLPASGRTLADRPVFYGYLDDPEQVPEAQLRTDIYLPLQPGTPA